MKKTLALLSTLIITLVLFGCASASFTQGRDFDTSKASQIIKGETTKKEITEWFGAPFSKSVMGTNGEMWIYMYTSGTSKATSYILKTDVKTDGIMKKLDLVFEGDVVVNFTLTDGGLPGTMTTTTGK